MVQSEDPQFDNSATAQKGGDRGFIFLGGLSKAPPIMVDFW
jgi:hypothetical protein